MGRELVFKKIKKSAIGLIVSGVFFTLLSIVFAFIYAMNDTLINGLFIIVICLLLGVPFLVLGIRDLINPMKNGIFKKNPYVLEQADNMVSHKMYEDKYIMLSDRCIANKKAITDISYLEDVFLVYIQKQSTNFIPTGKYLIVCTATGDFNINIYGSGKAAINELVSRISMVCPNVSIGYSNEGLAYLRQMRDIYKNNSGMINHRGYTQDKFVLPQYINNSNNQNTYNL